jgi:hypothetical protein
LISSNLLLADGIVEYTIKKPFNYLIIKDENLNEESRNKKAPSKQGFNINWYSQGGSSPLTNNTQYLRTF